mmetsp:Transcript_32332/g.75953  ORF Transcript_32332/g.75953 Transcript_32332/m.75953 type:complete len:368 (-) Transcript_32332:87-1190(-)
MCVGAPPGLEHLQAPPEAIVPATLLAKLNFSPFGSTKIVSDLTEAQIIAPQRLLPYAGGAPGLTTPLSLLAFGKTQSQAVADTVMSASEAKLKLQQAKKFADSMVAADLNGGDFAIGSLPCVPLATLQSWVQACERTKEASVAFVLLEYLQNHYGRLGGSERWMQYPGMCDALLGAFCKGGHADWAVGLFRYILEQHDSAPALSTICLAISALVKTGAHKEAVQWFRLLRCAGQTPNMTAYNALITSCGSNAGGGLQEAVTYYRWLTQDGWYPSMITFNALLDSVYKEAPAATPLESTAILINALMQQDLDVSCIMEHALRRSAKAAAGTNRCRNSRPMQQSCGQARTFREKLCAEAVCGQPHLLEL